jgi:hypothetical protein
MERDKQLGHLQIWPHGFDLREGSGVTLQTRYTFERPRMHTCEQHRNTTISYPVLICLTGVYASSTSLPSDPSGIAGMSSKSCGGRQHAFNSRENCARMTKPVQFEFGATPSARCFPAALSQKFSPILIEACDDCLGGIGIQAYRRFQYMICMKKYIQTLIDIL